MKIDVRADSRKPAFADEVPVWIGFDIGLEESRSVWASWVRGEFFVHDAELMTKSEIIWRREEAIRMRWPLIIIDEYSSVTSEMWDYLL